MGSFRVFLQYNVLSIGQWLGTHPVKKTQLKLPAYLLNYEDQPTKAWHWMKVFFGTL
jgi:hypothetical protein